MFFEEFFHQNLIAVPATRLIDSLIKYRNIIHPHDRISLTFWTRMSNSGLFMQMMEGKDEP